MSFAARPHTQALPAGNPVASLGAFVISDIDSFEAVASLVFNTDGTISKTGNNNSGGTVAWYSPTTVGIGPSYWIKFTLSSGDAWFGALVSGTLYQINTSRSLVWSAIEVHKTGLGTIQIYSDAGGTNLVASGTFLVEVDGTP